MSRSRRRFGEDLTYNVWHMERFPVAYERVSHRFTQADRDFTEYCWYCREPLFLVETLRDIGQDLRDKSVTATRTIAQRSQLEAYLVAWSSARPKEAQARIDVLNAELLEIFREFPPVRFRVGRIDNGRGPIRELQAREWADWIAVLHRDHHAHECKSHQAREFKFNFDNFAATYYGHPLNDGRLFRPEIHGTAA